MGSPPAALHGPDGLGASEQSDLIADRARRFVSELLAEVALCDEHAGVMTSQMRVHLSTSEFDGINRAALANQVEELLRVRSLLLLNVANDALGGVMWR